MREMQDRVRHFHRLFDGIVDDDPNWSERDHRMALIREEFLELDAEMIKAYPDKAKVAHEAGDLLITVLGLFVEIGVDAEEVVDAIMDANMTKDNAGPNRKPTKGDRFKPANVEVIVNPPSQYEAKRALGYTDEQIEAQAGRRAP